MTGTGRGRGQRFAAAGALAVLAVSLGSAAHIMWAQWRPLAASLVLGFVAITFLWWALTTRGSLRVAGAVVAALSSAGVIAAVAGIAGEWQELLILAPARSCPGRSRVWHSPSVRATNPAPPAPSTRRCSSTPAQVAGRPPGSTWPGARAVPAPPS